MVARPTGSWLVVSGAGDDVEAATAAGVRVGSDSGVLVVGGSTVCSSSTLGEATSAGSALAASAGGGVAGTIGAIGSGEGVWLGAEACSRGLDTVRTGFDELLAGRLEAAGTLSSTGVLVVAVGAVAIGMLLDRAAFTGSGFSDAT